MRVLRLVCLIVLVLCIVSPLLIKQLASNGPTVQVSVTTSPSNGFHYKWKSTDGTITNVDAASTTWVLPPGPGIHFAYVLVFDNHGGYTERRVAVNTDTIGTPPVIPPPITWSAPAAPAQTGDYYRSYAPETPNGVYWGNNFQSPIGANVLVYLQDTVSGKRFPATGGVTTDLKGQFIIPGLPPGKYTDHCSFDGGVSFEDCIPWNWSDPAFFSYTNMPATAWTYYIPSPPPNSPYPVPQPTVGNLQLQDGNFCGTINNFFGVSSTGTASWLDSTGRTLATVPLSAQGVYALPYNAKGASIKLQCESAAPITITGITPNTNGATIALQTVNGASDPVVTGMSALFNGSQVGLFLPPPSGFPSDAVPEADGFLAEKGLDTKLSACRYYLTIGAVKTCDASGNSTGAISFEDWKREVKIDKYATTTEYTATYINKADLNLTRNHHSVSYGPNETAAYVCNYLGYAVPNPFNQSSKSEVNDFLAPAQAEVDTALANATFGTGAPGKDLVACVAMDWGITANVNNGAPFTRFLIFGPSGQLLPSVNLDGKREKFVPGTCVVCHGGDHYAGQFPTDGTGPANIGAHFLTYDTGNFLFSSKVGLREVDQETAIFHLNQNVLNAGPTPAQKALIAGWYGNGQVLNQNYVPTSWQGQGTAATNFYQIVVARSCRGCHQALAENYNWDDYASAETAGLGGYLDGNVVCLGKGSLSGWRGHSMPNSLVTMNRFWLSNGSTVVPDQVTAFNQFPNGEACNPPPTVY
jgi:hypothetical protein